MTRPPSPAPVPIRADDASIEEALRHASIPTLMMSMVHMSGDLGILRGEVRPRKAVMGEGQGGLGEPEKAAVRAAALDVIRDWRDRGCPPPEAPAPQIVHEMMSFMVGEPVPDEYVPMMLEELALDGDARDEHWADAVPGSEKARLRVLVIGAGMSGLLAAIRLEEAGIPYTVVEKNEGPGGTWYENTYPGCRVDVANHFYCYSFEPNPDWSEFFSRQPELHAYFERCADRYGVRERIRFRSEVVSARWDDAEAAWRVRLRGPDGAEETEVFQAVVSAVGQLNRPKLPDIPGIETFAGAWFHSAQWDHGVELAGRRVAVVGTGASAVQLVPEVARVAGTLRVFQRSPGWMAPNPVYHRRVDEGARWCLKHLPFYGRWYRFLLFWPGSDGLYPSLVVDPDWPHPERSTSALNEQLRVVFTEYLKSQVGDDPELLEKVTPRYPPFGKRMLQDNGSWIAALKRENVELVGERIERVVPDGIVTADGTHHPLDVIVYATGFHANRFLWPMEIEGRDGVKLGTLWGDDPQAYLGISVPRFPNLFCLYGPGTNLAHAGSIIFHSECQVRYVLGCLRALLEKRRAAIECRQEVLDEYIRRFDATHAGMVWSHPGMDSWYKNASGRVTCTSPWRLVDYWSWTRRPDLADYELW